MADETLLSWTGDGVSPYSARGLTQSLEPIAAAENMRRTINGTARDLSAPQFRKYKSAIVCADQVAPALDDVWPGDVLTVNCVKELSYKTAGGSPARSVVSGSSRVEGAHTLYRPVIVFMVMTKTETKDEYGCVDSWQLTLEEV